MTHGRHIYAKESDMAKATMCAYPQYYHTLTHRKFVMKCCAKCPSVNLPDQEIYDQYSNNSSSIIFHIYHLIACCTTHGRLPLNYRKLFCKYKQDSISEQPTKIIHQKRASDNGDNNIEFSHKFIYSRNSEVGVSHCTCTNTGYKSLW